uniref:Soluble pyridine nucleotide transhydrogenase n=1 Tax=Schlesneria paludicola TaxID=360056 RepID=A0A7C4QRR6_9PLAN
MRYDLLVIGSGPAGQRGAIAAAKLGKKVALVERRNSRIGGVCLHTGTIPSKTMREAILHLTGYRQRRVYNERYVQKRHITLDDLRRKLDQVIQHEMHVIQEYLDRNEIDVYAGEARFAGPREVEVCREGQCTLLEAKNVLIACGTRPARPPHIPFDGQTIFDSDELLALEQMPRSMIVIGAGVIGMEYALMFATLGVEVTIVDGRERILDFCDREIVDSLIFHARSQGMVFRLGEDVVGIDRLRNKHVAVQLESGKRLIAEAALFTTGRVGDTDGLNLAAAGLTADERGRIWCDETHRTWVPHIYAVGDVVGFPALASAAMEQGRRAVCAMFQRPFLPARCLPYGLYTIPEVSMVGQTEQQLTADRVPYEVGMCSFREIARGHISGDETGLLKLLFHRETRRLLGVHIIGDTATEIIHIGQTVISLGGTIDYFRDAVFNYPTMTEAYKVAAFNGLNKLGHELAEGEVDPSDTAPEADALEKVSALRELCVAAGT